MGTRVPRPSCQWPWPRQGHRKNRVRTSRGVLLPRETWDRGALSLPPHGAHPQKDFPLPPREGQDDAKSPRLQGGLPILVIKGMGNVKTRRRTRGPFLFGVKATVDGPVQQDNVIKLRTTACPLPIACGCPSLWRKRPGSV